MLKVPLTTLIMIMLNELHCDPSTSDADVNHNLLQDFSYTKSSDFHAYCGSAF